MFMKLEIWVIYVGVLFFFVDIIIWYIIFYICIIFLVYLFVSVLFFKYMESYLNFVL